MLRDRDPALAVNVAIISKDSDSAQVLAAVTFPATDGKQIKVKKKKKQNSSREKPGSTYQTMRNGNCLAALHLSIAKKCDLEGKHLLIHQKATLTSVLDMSDIPYHSDLWKWLKANWEQTDKWMVRQTHRCMLLMVTKIEMFMCTTEAVKNSILQVFSKSAIYLFEHKLQVILTPY